MKNEASRILCMGSINMDLTMFMERMPEPGETVATDNFATYPGGKAGNQAVAAARLGGNVNFFGKLGDDVFSKELIEGMNQNGVNTKNIIIESGATAGIAMIRIDEKGINSISFSPGANALLTIKDVEENIELFRQNQILLITLEIPKEIVAAAIKLAKKEGMIVVLDPAPAPEDDFLMDMAEYIDYVKPNEIEVEQITGIKVTGDTAEDSFAKMIELGFGCPVITMGENGCVSWIDGKAERFIPPKVEVVDTTAAGDVYLGAFTASIANKSTVRKAIEFATIASAMSTTIKGAQNSIPSIKQVNDFITSGKV